MGKIGEAKNTVHQTKKLSDEDIKAFRDRFNIPIPDSQLAELPFYKPADDTPEMKYLHERRKALGGYARRPRNLHHASLRALSHAAAARPGPGPARGAHPGGRSPYLRHGRPVPPDRHLQPRRPAVHPGR